MGIRSDSYGSTGEVKAFTRHLLDGQSGFNSTTRPSGPELEKFIDRASAILNSALNVKGFDTPVANSTAKLACDDWVTARSVEYVEMTKAGVGYTDQEGTRHVSFKNLAGPATKFVEDMELGFRNLGVPQAIVNIGEGLKFTGEIVQVDRTDPEDGGLQQPTFKRGLFDA